MGHDADDLMGDELQGSLLAQNIFPITMLGGVAFVFACYFVLM